jgi:putative FmdB family regulatory protein
MPVYEFECDAHGTFDEQRPMSLARASAACPACGGQARRVLSAPHVAQLATSERRARDVNERSRHEPRLAQREPPRSQDPPSPRMHATHGRPWAIGH